jgi:hypothetical protein
MNYTVLEMTQNILASMDSDEVSSISDTAESQQVSEIIRTAYFNILSRANLPEHKTLFQLIGESSSYPVLLNRPSTVSYIEWIKYNNIDDDGNDTYEYITILPLQQFLDNMHMLQNVTDVSTVESFVLNDATYYFTNDTKPRYCTIIDDYYVLFDSYDNTVDTTNLQNDKTLCYGQTLPAFTLNDSFVPDLDDQQFPLLLNEAKSLAFLELKQIAHDQAVLESRRQWRTLQRTKELNKPKAMDQFANFGRR